MPNWSPYAGESHQMLLRVQLFFRVSSHFSPREASGINQLPAAIVIGIVPGLPVVKSVVNKTRFAIHQLRWDSVRMARIL